MNIAHVITELEVGGAEKQMALILPQLDSRFTNHVICLRGRGLYGEKLRQAGIPVHYLDGTGLLDLHIPWRLYRVLRQIQPDISIGYLFQADMQNRLISRLLRIPVTVSSQRSSLVGQQRWRRLDQSTARLVTHYHTLTRRTAHVIQAQWHRAGSTVTVIPNAVEEAASALLLFHSPLHIICVASLKPGKGHDVLLVAFARWLKQHPGAAVLHVVGDGELDRALRSEAERLGIAPAVYFAGRQHDILQRLQASDIFVLPTLGEEMSNAILEAMSAGLPIITTDLSVNREIIRHGETGWLIPAGDAGALASAFTQLSQDPELARRLGRAAQAYVRQHHAIPVIVKQWHTLLSQLS